MITSIFASEDATLYEASSSQNTGNDAILEIAKTGQISGSQLASGTIFNSRILVKFPITQLSQSLVDTYGSIPIGINYRMRLFTVEANEVPTEYSLEAFPISESFTRGTGKFHDFPVDEDSGTSWKYRNGKLGGTEWATSSFAADAVTGSMIGQSVSGGGTWHHQYGSSQTFGEVTDIDIDVTTAVSRFLSGHLPNHGFILKRTGSLGIGNETNQEQNNTVYGSLKFFSRESATIYQPRLDAFWDDTDMSGTASLSQVDDTDLMLYMRDLREQYRENSRVKFRVNGRKRFNARTYSTKSADLTNFHLPTSSYYSVLDARTEEVIVPFITGSTNATKLSVDSEGNYFNFWLDGLHTDRIYKFVYLVESGSYRNYYDDGFTFKVVR